ncbi:unnamed protein product [Amoebophrya sp. A25]|nr:unnamed protein product [Amoebophrya sp. A25]|eukprot:GSA25T00008949001.1
MHIRNCTARSSAMRLQLLPLVQTFLPPERSRMSWTLSTISKQQLATIANSNVVDLTGLTIVRRWADAIANVGFEVEESCQRWWLLLLFLFYPGLRSN